MSSGMRKTLTVGVVAIIVAGLGLLPGCEDREPTGRREFLDALCTAATQARGLDEAKRYVAIWGTEETRESSRNRAEQAMVDGLWPSVDKWAFLEATASLWGHDDWRCPALENPLPGTYAPAETSPELERLQLKQDEPPDSR